MELTVPDQLPQLAFGGHEKGSGNACIMNAISYLNGDKKITDMPNCVFRPLAKVAQELNDSICKEPVNVGRGYNRVELLCPMHTHMMWLFGGRLIGTGEAARNLVGANPWRQANLAIQLGVWAVDYLQPRALGTINMVRVIQAWLAKEIATPEVRRLCPDVDCADCMDGVHDDEDSLACSAATSLVNAITNGVQLRMDLTITALTEIIDGYNEGSDKMAFAYALLGEFDRLTDQTHLHQWTEDEFALVHEKAQVPLITIS